MSKPDGRGSGGHQTSARRFAFIGRDDTSNVRRRRSTQSPEDNAVQNFDRRLFQPARSFARLPWESR
ncbi:hypothetical protein SAMN05444159_1337 [Bradyrhizobium lablabi]|uniref:Uncharacterized protein n=1 Tax=Bradyrhizobium lablabi TaxID=722472 RepID=A0A1M6LP27_9BRAD|nr:hypothetical protein SAMN05444159_1337 [Bradyrhizobium lablabi]